MFQKMLQVGGGSEPTINNLYWENSNSPQVLNIPKDTYLVILASNDISGSVNMYNNSSTAVAGVTKTQYGNVCVYTDFKDGGILNISSYSSSGTAICVS